MTNTTVEDILGEHSVEGIRVKDANTGEEAELAVDGFFAAIGHVPATTLFTGQVEMDESGYVLQKEHTMTSVPGVFAAGDVSDTRYRQAVTAAGDGCRSAIDAERWMEDQARPRTPKTQAYGTPLKRKRLPPPQPAVKSASDQE
jgi:thioredoxin reductase (NADPH)